jgi:hypothetical protein
MSSARIAWPLCLLFGLTANACTVRSGPVNSCGADSSVIGCPGNSFGYSCPGASAPTQSDTPLSCGPGTQDPDGRTDYCCVSGSAAGSCVPDPAQTGCLNGSSGYTCVGGQPPSSTDTTLNCGAGVQGNNGDVLYCCIALTGSNTTCAADANVAGCTGGAYGYSCTGADSPDQANSSLSCSDPVSGPGSDSLYCCVGFNASGTSCMADPQVVGCTGSSFGFSCASSDTPPQANPSLTCSTPAAGPNGESLYCCTE